MIDIFYAHPKLDKVNVASDMYMYFIAIAFLIFMVTTEVALVIVKHYCLNKGLFDHQNDIYIYRY